jgi:NADPH:quinone reductase-like Zn-dependent oxidoreductase
LDLIGGEIQKRSWSVLKRGGSLVSTLGQPSEDEARKHGVRALGYMAQPNASQLMEIAALIDRGQVKPMLAARFTLEQVRSAQERVEKEHTQGKVVLDVVRTVHAAV